MCVFRVCGGVGVWECRCVGVEVCVGCKCVGCMCIWGVCVCEMGFVGYYRVDGVEDGRCRDLPQ